MWDKAKQQFFIMKTKLFLVAAIVIGFATTSVAQQKFNVQNGTKTEFYEDLETAIEKAVSGDTIYLPGRVIQVQNDLIIDKKLAIIGAGCDADSIGGLLPTDIRINSGNVTIRFRNGSDGSLLTGCIVGAIVFGHRDEFNVYQQNIKNITFWRNKITGSISLGLSTTNNQVKQIFISENILSVFAIAINGYGASDCIINNNLFINNGNVNISNVKNSRINNNVLRYSISTLEGCIVENNFFSTGSPISGTCSNSSFNNNAFSATSFTIPSGNNSESNNLVNQETIRTFIVNTLTLPKNLKIRDDSPCKNAGTDGTDIGIFGGAAPYKDGAVPLNPHINKAVIATQTGKDGNLKVDITVSAQTR